MAKILGQDAKKLAAITLAIKILGQDLAQDRTQDFFTGKQNAQAVFVRSRGTYFDGAITK